MDSTKRKVFISSVYQEFWREVRATKPTLEDQGLEISEFKQGFGGSIEHYFEEYSKLVRQAHIFIGIYGSSYGALMPSSTAPFQSDISYLEWEYRMAEELGIPTLVFVQDVRYREEKLTELLRRVVTRKGGYAFRGEKDLVEGIRQRIQNLAKQQGHADTEPITLKPNVRSTHRVFLSYAREDIGAAQRLFSELEDEEINIWFDKKSLLAGQRWKPTIKAAIRDCRFFVALLSSNSVSKKGYVQKELKYALEILDEYPESTIFVIPVRLDDCRPADDRLSDLHWVDMFPEWDTGLALILKTIAAQT